MSGIDPGQPAGGLAPTNGVPIITDDMSTLEVALELAKAGTHVFPVDHPGLPQCAGRAREHDPKTCDQRGKHPCVAWGEGATTDPRKIRTWFTGAPRNIGINCGKSNLVVIDEDKIGELERYAIEHGVQIPPTMVVSTAKGFHYYFRPREDLEVTNAEGEFSDYSINVRGQGGFVVGPSSVHKTGVVYTITAALPVAPIPDWIIEAVKTRPTATLSTNGHTEPVALEGDSTGQTIPYGRRALDGELAKLDAVAGPHSRKRNTQLNKSALKIGRVVAGGHLNEKQALTELEAKGVEIGLTPGEVAATVRSGFRKGMESPRTKEPYSGNGKAQVHEMTLEEIYASVGAFESGPENGHEMTHGEGTPGTENNKTTEFDENPGYAFTPGGSFILDTDPEPKALWVQVSMCCCLTGKP